MIMCLSFYMDCRETIYSEDVYDFIMESPMGEQKREEQICQLRISEQWDIYYYSSEGLPALNVGDYTYTAIPDCYTLQDRATLEAAGILGIQNLSGFELKGRNVIVGMIDTGIEYTNASFRYSDGSSRIAAIWDQTDRSGTAPEGFIYGSEYMQRDINDALRSENPYDIVPTRDENGHGTFLAALAAGSESADGTYLGAAPEALIAVVKLKEAKQYLRDFYYIPEGVPAYQENDVMAAVSYLHWLGFRMNMPVSICFAMGTNMGSHGGNSPLSLFMDEIGILRGRAISVAAGNEAIARHHYYGEVAGDDAYEDVEISVGENVNGFTMELWSSVPDLFSVSIISPTGEILPRIPPRRGESAVYTFLFEQTTVRVDYQIVGSRRANQLIFLRFSKPVKGIWNLRVYNEYQYLSTYHIWLPITEFLNGEVFFIRSNPEVTITTPGMSDIVMTVGAYNTVSGGIYPESGRGYSTTGKIKPEFAMPGVNIEGIGLFGNVEQRSGTSVAVALNAGAAALFLEWGIEKRNEVNINTINIKNYLIRGAVQEDNRNVPNTVWGYGKANLFRSFERLRIT